MTLVQTASLEDRARSITQALGGNWSRLRGMCRCPAHDDRTPSLSISVGRSAILVHCFAGCTNDAVLVALAMRGIKLSDMFDGKRIAAEPVARLDVVDRNALRIWREAKSLTDSPAARYLASRGISIHSPDLRFHAKTPLGPKGAVRFLPAMISAVRNDVGILALHRTFLDIETNRLANFETPKRALGSPGSGAVRLKFPQSGRLGLAEGVETALSAMQMFQISCWATLGNERFGLVAIPDSVRELVLFVDNDAGGRLAETRARKAYARPGRRIITGRPDCPGEDWNDVLMRRSILRIRDV